MVFVISSMYLRTGGLNRAHLLSRQWPSIAAVSQPVSQTLVGASYIIKHRRLVVLSLLHALVWVCYY